MWRFVMLIAVLACLPGCGATSGLSKLEGVVQVAAGGVDPSLLGTFRIDQPDHESPRALRLLVLRKDGKFHGELVDACTDAGCTAIPVDGSYIQTRAMPDPGRASGVTIGFLFDEGGDAGLSYLTLSFKRALIANSPQVSLYHDSTDQPATPYFQLNHPLELWCAADDDCDAQVLTASCPQACQASQCACR